MIFISILLFIVAIALPSIHISSNLYIRIFSNILLYSGLLAHNAINIPTMGSGIGLQSFTLCKRLLSHITYRYTYLYSFKHLLIF